MALTPEPVYTRRIALIEEYGFHANDVAADGFDVDHFTAVGWYDIDGLRCDKLAEMDALPKTRIWWRPEHRARAQDAIMGDYREQFGDEPFARVQALRAQLNQ